MICFRLQDNVNFSVIFAQTVKRQSSILLFVVVYLCEVFNLAHFDPIPILYLQEDLHPTKEIPKPILKPVKE